MTVCAVIANSSRPNGFRFVDIQRGRFDGHRPDCFCKRLQFGNGKMSSQRDGNGHSRRNLFRHCRWHPARLLSQRRRDFVELRHRATDSNRQRGRDQRRHARWWWPGCREWNAVHELRVRTFDRPAGKFAAGFFGGWEMRLVSLLRPTRRCILSSL